MLCNLSLIDLSCADVDPDNDKNDDEDGASAFITGGGGDRVGGGTRLSGPGIA